MKHVIRESIGFFVIGVLGAFYIGQNSDLPTFYQKNLQGNLFSGFLALGGFLLSLKTFIVVKLHEGIFERDSYEERYKVECEQFPENINPYYGPLRNLSDFLVWSVGLSLITSVAQLTLGYVKQLWAVSICLGFAAVSLWLVLRAWWEIKGNLATWFELLEEEREKRNN